MGSNSSSGGGDTGPANRYSTPKKKVIDFVKGGGVVGTVVRAVSKNIKETKAKKDMQNSLDYEGAAYGTKRGSTYVTSNRGGNDNNSNQVVQAAVIPKVTGPTTAEVSQVVPEVTSEEARATANELIKKKRRGRGRSLMIATSSQGAKDEGLTLSEKTLLG